VEENRTVFVICSLIVMAIGFLVLNFTSSFVTEAKYNKDMQALVEIQKDIEYIKNAIRKIELKIE